MALVVQPRDDSLGEVLQAAVLTHLLPELDELNQWIKYVEALPDDEYFIENEQHGLVRVKNAAKRLLDKIEAEPTRPTQSSNNDDPWQANND